MNKTTTLRMAPIVVVLLAVSFARCRKGVDAFGHGLVDCNDCNIQQITVVHTDELGKDTVVYSFAYNAAGDPVTVKNTAVATGNPNAVFKYDRRGKLAEMVRPYDNTSYETWTKYFYDRRGQIVRDTQYIFGTYIDSVPGADLKQGYWIHHFGYDAYGRVVSRIDSSFFGSVSVTGHSFQYDARGNLVVSGAVYDMDVNFLRTNKIWMFVCNNYSVNNAFLATAYNGHKLPLSFDGVYPTMAPVVTETGKYKMVYKCR